MQFDCIIMINESRNKTQLELILSVSCILLIPSHILILVWKIKISDAWQHTHDKVDHFYWRIMKASFHQM